MNWVNKMVCLINGHMYFGTLKEVDGERVWVYTCAGCGKEKRA